MIHVYALTDDPDVTVPTRGIGDAPVEVIAAGGFGIAVSRHPEEAATAATDDIVAHARVCDALLGVSGAVLPVRFGARYRTDDTVRAAVAERQTQLSAALRHVRHRVEVGVRVVRSRAEGEPPPGTTAASTSSGTGYLRHRATEERRRAARHEAARALADQLHAVVGAAALDHRTQVLSSAEPSVSVAYLVTAESVDDVARAVAAWGESRSDVQVICTGPWPPYHFTGEGALT